MTTKEQLESVLECRINSGTKFSACFTGRRPKDIHGYDKDAYAPIIAYLGQVLESLYQNSFRNFISGGAQGFDQLAFWTVDLLKKQHKDIMNRVYVPFPKQPSRWAKYGLFSQKEYHDMLTVADEARILNPDPDPKKGFGTIVGLLHGRNHVMVGDADLVIAFLTGDNIDWRNAKGGTAECIRYAVSQNKPILSIIYRPGTETLFEAKFISDRLLDYQTKLCL